MSKRLVGALDLGTDKAYAVVAEVHDDGQIIVIGTGSTETEGVVRGAVSDLDQAAATASRAVREAEKGSGVKMPPLFLSVAGSHVRSEEGYADAVISGDPPDIRNSDIDKLIKKVKDLPVSPDEDLIHLIPNEFALDGIGSVHIPVGMAARRIEVKACRILVQHAPLQNLIRSLERAKLEIASLMVQALASGEAVLTADEKDTGVLLLDLGEGTTDLAFYGRGSVLHASSVPIGGYYFTRDIALGLQISREQARFIKEENGNLQRLVTESPPPIHLPVLEGKETRRISAASVTDILEARMLELCGKLKRNLSQVDMTDQFPRSMVITGGAAHLSGVSEYLSREFRLPVRIAGALDAENLPEMLQTAQGATVVGLLRYGIRLPGRPVDSSKQGSTGEGGSGNILFGIRRTLQDFFRPIRNMQ